MSASKGGPLGPPFIFCQTPLDCPIMDTSGSLRGVIHRGGRYNGGSLFELIPGCQHAGWKLATLYGLFRKTGFADRYRPEVCAWAPVIFTAGQGQFGKTSVCLAVIVQD